MIQASPNAGSSSHKAPTILSEGREPRVEGRQPLLCRKNGAFVLRLARFAGSLRMRGALPLISGIGPSHGRDREPPGPLFGPETGSAPRARVVQDSGNASCAAGAAASEAP